MDRLPLRRRIVIKIFTIVSTLFWIIRQYAIPNPFDALGAGLTIYIGESALLLTPEVLNWLADPLIYGVTFIVVGLYYRSGSEPVLGSILYMVFYCIHIGLLYLILSCHPITWLMIVIAVAYIALHIAALILKSRIDWQ